MELHDCLYRDREKMCVKQIDCNKTVEALTLCVREQNTPLLHDLLRQLLRLLGV